MTVESVDQPSREAISRRDILKGSAAAGAAALVSGAPSMAETESRAFDYIVVGSGPGGGPLACNLAQAGYTVCLIEAGGAATDADLETNIAIPANGGLVSADPRVAWEFFVRHYSDEAQQKNDSKYVADRDGILYPRSSTIGGCSVHTGEIMQYPSDSDWEHIVELTGDQSWAPDRMRNYFQRLEQNRYANPADKAARHGFLGWQPIEMPDPRIFYNDPQMRQVLASAVDVAGQPGDLDRYLANKLDPNDYRVTKANKEGLYANPLYSRDGVRFGVRQRVMETAKAYPSFLKIMTDCLVTRVLLDDRNTATGVEYMQGPSLYRASPLTKPTAPPPRQQIRALREVIISGGTFNSPQILKLSGIGPRDELSKFGIKTRVDLPGVGTGMMDRYEVSVVTELKSPTTLFEKCVAGSPTDPCLLDWKQGQGVYTTTVAVSVVRKSDRSRVDRDLFINLTSGPFRGFFPGWEKVFNPTQFGWAVLKAHTKNRAGTVLLRSNDPRDVPAINFHYFQEGTDHAGEDLDAVIDGVRTIRQMNKRISNIASSEVIPGPAVKSDEDLRTFVKNEAWGHHACCSNRMGPKSDAMAVVDSEFKVFGTQNLRVVDFSVFPRIPGYFPMVPILMISEKASDVILADARGGHRHNSAAD
ncbi:GMC family oxidoreductase [Bradyrhizobium sp. Ai1a-2]|uniref:GMC family oxidoreductase n=1 Tax=Bradyrhizobium sp. Ai1a-2 TaxID=196490 RepID=UPI00040DA9E9|nr:GMC family oxidoreductase [Bradyrhizobium sp. Ai1a-2]